MGERARTSRLHRRERIRRSVDIRELMRRGERWNGASLRVVWRENRLGYDRVAVLVSRRVGNAVARNRAKRRLRALFRTHKSENAPFYDVAMVAREPLTRPYRDLECQYLEWKRACEESSRAGSLP